MTKPSCKQIQFGLAIVNVIFFSAKELLTCRLMDLWIKVMGESAMDILFLFYCCVDNLNKFNLDLRS